MFFSDAASGLRAIIAIHRLRGGRSGGGAAQVGLITRAQMEARLRGIGETAMRIFRTAEERGVSTEEAASSLAEEKLLEEIGATSPHPTD